MKQKLSFEFKDNILVVGLPSDYSLKSAAEQTINFVENLNPTGKIGLLMDLTEAREAREVSLVRGAFKHWEPLREWVSQYAVLAESELHWGLTRQVAIFAEEEGFTIRPFKRKEDAMKWLAS